MQRTPEVVELEKFATENNGHCDRCGQTIKIYRYKVSKTHGTFLRAMAKTISNTGINNVDIGDLEIPYSVRSQVTKLRQHGLVARIKNESGAQVARRWLITHKGWDFLNGKPIPSHVIVFNNQVLGHDGEPTTVLQVMGEKFNPEMPKYEEASVTQAEARTYDDLRKPKKPMMVKAIYRGSKYERKFDVGKTYGLGIERLQVGCPVVITSPENINYKDIAAFQKDWKAL